MDEESYGAPPPVLDLLLEVVEELKNHFVDRLLSGLGLLLVMIPLATAAAAGAAWQIELPTMAIGFALLIGVVAFLAVALGGLGASVSPRDRNKSGNIDFGR